MEKEYLEALKTHQAEYLNTVWKTFAALMVAIGWMITSDKTREYFCYAPIVKYVAIVVVVLMAVMHLLTLYDLYDKSAKIKNKIFTKDGLEDAIISSYEIKRTYVAASFLINGLLYILLVTIILSVKFVTEI